MPVRHLALFLIVAVITAVFASAAHPVHPQTEPPPRPFRDIENLERLPTAPDPEQMQPENLPEAVRLPWSKVVFQSYRNNNWEIYRSNDDGSATNRLTFHGDADSDPRLNRGGTRVVFASNRDGGVYQIYVMNADGSGQSQLTHTSGHNVYPNWSPDGSKIIFQSYRDGQAEIYVMNADGSGQTRLTNHPEYDGTPSWSPDGAKVVFSSRRSGQYYIYTMNANGSNVTLLADYPYSFNPIWSPDGSKVAFDADINWDGWQELFVIDLDTRNIRSVRDPSGQTDAWARSWSPDGRFIAYTLINFTYYQGVWYWVDAYLEAVNVQNGNTFRLSSSGLDWRPDWQTTDNIRPASAVQPLPSVSPGPIPVRWSGSDSGGAGIKTYDIQVMVNNNGVWLNWLSGTTATSGEYPGTGGNTYAFRSRARDHAYNLEPWPNSADARTTVETLPPETAVIPLPSYSNAPGFTLTWGGHDPGGSGIHSYDIQFRTGAGGSWTNWLMGTTSASGTFTGVPGQTYYFRARATDRAGNQENWPSGDGDTASTAYAWMVNGFVRDNSGAPVSAAQVSVNPAAVAPVFSAGNGAFQAYTLNAAAQYQVELGKAGYGDLPPTLFGMAGNGRFSPILPPADNLIQNGDFESGNLTGWTGSGLRGTAPASHTGDYAARLGAPPTFAPIYTIGEGQIPEMALAPDGTIHAVWAGVYWRGVFYAYRSPDGVWSAPQNLSNDVARTSQPQLAVTSAGVVTVAWTKIEPDSPYETVYRQRDANGVWSPRQVLSVHQSTSTVSQMKLVADQQQTLHLVWNEGYQLFYSQRPLSGDWSPPKVIQPGLEFFIGGDINLNVHIDGRVHICWQSALSLPSSPRRLYHALYSSGAWQYTHLSGEALISADSQICHLDGQGNLHVVWVDRDTSIWKVEGLYYLTRSEAGLWSARRRLASDGLLADMIVDSEGTVYIAWGINEDASYMTQRSASGDWSMLHTFTGSNNSQTRLAIDGHGVLHAVWTEQADNNVFSQVLYAARGRDGVWSAPQQISDISASQWINQRIIADANNNIHILTDRQWGSSTANYHGPAMSSATAVAEFSQTITVPISNTTALSFLYQSIGLLPGGPSRFSAAIHDGQQSTPLFTSDDSPAGWQHVWADLSPWAGQTVSLNFHLAQGSGVPLAWVYLDDVTVGAAYPDVWVLGSGGNALPNQLVTHTLTYGNQGGAIAAGTRLTYTLPAELSFVSASQPPISTDPLVWELGDLAARSGPFNLSVVVAVEETAVPLTTLHSPAAIQPGNAELETLNNNAQSGTFIGHLVFLPLMNR